MFLSVRTSERGILIEGESGTGKDTVPLESTRGQLGQPASFSSEHPEEVGRKTEDSYGTFQSQGRGSLRK